MYNDNVFMKIKAQEIDNEKVGNRLYNINYRVWRGAYCFGHLLATACINKFGKSRIFTLPDS